ncbi:type IV pilin protein [Acinetobacter ursingii]|uniref:Type IV pilin protein n=1 Tax=Acinetobacter ursingii TaxID=108980 RepID=A0AA46NR49_9GAMM|nr:type IV pilin protein [Acinetobacter ursingii]UYF72124.1 type IV pilin protein [Acinetobacter ursingii]
MVNKGFTLIEVMIVVVIIAILAAIAYPSYTQYRVRTNRADVQKELLSIAQQMSAYKVATGTYAGTNVNTIYGSTVYPQGSAAIYDLTFDPVTTTASEWVLIAKPKSGTIQAGNGWICLNDQGQKYWAKGATACALSATSTWDGR